MRNSIDAEVREHLAKFIIKYLLLTEEEEQIIKNIIKDKRLAELEKIRKEKEQKRFAKKLKVPNLKVEIKKIIRSILK